MSTTTDVFKQFSVGTEWMIKDLTSETGKKFNGKTCVIVSTFDVTSGRVGVRIKNARKKGRTLNIKPINLHADQSTTLMEGVKQTTTPQEAEDVEDCPQEEEDKEDCPICTDALPKLSNQFTRLCCCGKGLHNKCYQDLMTNTSMTFEQKSTCIMCRAKMVKTGSKGEIERYRKWVKKGKAWAMVMLADRYRDGVGVKQSDKKAIELLEMAAKKGHASAQYNLARLYRQGMLGLTQSSKRAFELYTLAAEQGFVHAQYDLGLMYDFGDGIEQSTSKAREWWTKAAAQGDESAIKNLKIMDLKDATKSDKTAFELWTLAADQGYAEAQYNLGNMYANGDGIGQSNSKAREWWTKAAAQGFKEAIEALKERVKSSTTQPEVVNADTISCSTCGKQQTKAFRLGKCACRTKRYCNSQCQKKQYKQHKKECLRLVKERKKKKNGQDLKKDGTKGGKNEKAKPIQEEEDTEDCPICQDALPRLSIHFVRLGCCGKGLHKKCNTDLETNKSMTLEQKNTCIMCRAKHVDNGSKEDIERLHKWTKKGKAWAMCLLAQRYKDGVGVKQSNKKANELYEMAAKRGNATAQYILGQFYQQGIHGVAQSSKRASEYYTLAANQGDAFAQFNLGTMYANGDGIEQSDKKAIELFEMAAKRGDANAQHNLGLYYHQGIHGLTQSSKKAIEYYTLAANQGIANTQYNLGAIYANGLGIETSYSKAREWWTKAAAQGDEQAIKGLKQLDELGL